MDKTKIEWTDSTWNPITGCTKISEGCQHCYAERMAKRLKAMRSARYAEGFKLTVQDDLFDLPLSWKEPRTVFVNSMSDLFHEDLPLETIQKIFATMNKAHWHRFQILTKRADVLREYAPHLSWTPNIWMGVTIESERHLSRLDALKTAPAAIRFVSFEPLLTDIPSTTDLTGIDWAIVGGESGPGARPMSPDWVGNIKLACDRDKVAFFFKQWGGTNKKAAGRLLEGRTWDEMPTPIFLRA